MVLDNYCEIEIEGKKYKMCLRNRCVFAAEAELVNGNLSQGNHRQDSCELKSQNYHLSLKN